MRYLIRLKGTYILGYLLPLSLEIEAAGTRLFYAEREAQGFSKVMNCTCKIPQHQGIG